MVRGQEMWYGNAINLDTGLHRCLREIVWVSQLGSDVEAEVGSVLNGGVAEPDTCAPTLFEDLLQQQRFQNRVQFFSHVF